MGKIQIITTKVCPTSLSEIEFQLSEIEFYLSGIEFHLSEIGDVNDNSACHISTCTK